MLSIARLRRLLFALLAVVQTMAPALATMGEGRLFAASVAQGDRTHVEDHTRPGCTPVHTDNCALCSFLSHCLADRAPAARPPVVCRATFIATRDECDALPGALRAHLRTRAPPTAA